MTAFQNINYLKWLKEHQRALLVVQVIAIIGAVIFSSPTFMPQQFKSYAVVYPYNFSPYSHETPTEQMMEFLSSNDIKQGVIKKFDLIKHYDIDTNEREWKSRLLEKYDKDVLINNTEYEAVEIIVYDGNADMAYKMVNGILSVLNDKVLKVQQEKSMESARMWKKQLDFKKTECDSLSNLSKSLSTQYGLLDYGSQTREVTKAYYSGSKSGDVTTQMKNMEEKGIELQGVDQHLNAALSNYDDLLVKYEDAEREVHKQLTYSNVITAPYAADKKSYPIRWLVVLMTCLSAFVFSAVVIRALERFKS